MNAAKSTFWEGKAGLGKKSVNKKCYGFATGSKAINLKQRQTFTESRGCKGLIFSTLQNCFKQFHNLSNPLYLKIHQIAGSSLYRHNLLYRTSFKRLTTPTLVVVSQLAYSTATILPEKAAKAPPESTWLISTPSNPESKPTPEPEAFGGRTDGGCYQKQYAERTFCERSKGRAKTTNIT